jgi:hypothetical protein
MTKALQAPSNDHIESDDSKPAESTTRPTISVTRKPGVQPDDAMSEAGRKVLRYHFARLLDQEPAVHKAADP